MEFIKFLPYLLPVITIVAFTVIAFTNPEITGFVVIQQDKEIVSSKVSIFLDDDSMLPIDSVVKVSLDGKEATMSLTEFIDKSNGRKDIITAELEEIGYKGQGYRGENNYEVDLKEFNLGLVNKQAEHNLVIKVIYNDRVLLESEKTVQGKA